MKYTVLIMACIGLLSACQKDKPLQAQKITTNVGMMRMSYIDAGRQNWDNDAPRPMATMIWYPMSESLPAQPFKIPRNKPIFNGGLAVRGGAPDTAKKRPLILLSHGTGGAAFQTMWLGRRLASAGYIVAAIDHHGNTAAEDHYDPRGFQLVTERPKDMSAVLDQLLADEKLAPLIDENSIAAIGFSLGGYTVLALAGGRIDFARMEKFCASHERDAVCEPQSEFPEAGKLMVELAKNDPRIAISEKEHTGSFADPRIDYVAALAPALGGAFTKESLVKINIPIHIIVGAGDQIAPLETNGKIIASAIPGSQFDVIKGDVSHYIFLNECTEHGRKYVPLCKDANGISRAKIHDKTAGIILKDLALVFGH